MIREMLSFSGDEQLEVTYVVVRYQTSWWVRLLPWNHDPCITGLHSQYLVPATILRNRQRKPCRREESAYQIISRPQELHYTLLRSNLTSLRNYIPIAWSLNKNVRNRLFASRVVYPDIVLWCEWSVAPHLERLVTHSNTHYHLRETTMAN